MKYLVTVQGSRTDYDAQAGKGSPESPVWDEKAPREMFAPMGGINDDLAESGEPVTAYGLTEPAQGRAVSLPRGGRGHPRRPREPLPADAGGPAGP